MNQEKFEEAYIRSNAQLALVVEGRFGDALKRAGKGAVGAVTGRTARNVVKSVGRGTEATIASAGRVVGAGAKAGSDQVDKKISKTARKVYDKAKEKAPVVGKVGSALAPTVKAASDQADKEADRFKTFAKKKISSAYKGAKEKVKGVLKKGADVAREKVGLDPVKEAYIRANAQLAFVIAEGQTKLDKDATDLARSRARRGATKKEIRREASRLVTTGKVFSGDATEKYRREHGAPTMVRTKPKKLAGPTGKLPG